MFKNFQSSGIGSMPENIRLLMHKYANSRHNYADFYGNYVLISHKLILMLIYSVIY